MTPIKILIALLLLTFPSFASAGLLFGDRVTVYNGAPSSGYTVRYGRSYSYGPTHRTFRTYRQPVVTYSTPASGYYLPPPAAQIQVQTAPAPAAAPADPAPAQDPAPAVQTYSVPAYSVRSYTSASYFAADDDAAVTKVRHREKHKRGRHKVSHKESSR